MLILSQHIINTMSLNSLIGYKRGGPCDGQKRHRRTVDCINSDYFFTIGCIIGEYIKNGGMA